MITTATIAAHIAMMRTLDPDYAEYARGWYWNLLGPYIRLANRRALLLRPSVLSVELDFFCEAP